MKKNATISVIILLVFALALSGTVFAAGPPEPVLEGAFQLVVAAISAARAAASPLAQRGWATDGVSGVFFGTDFVTVTKADDVEWDHIKPAILGAIMEHFQSGQPVIEGEGGMTPGRVAESLAPSTASSPAASTSTRPCSSSGSGISDAVKEPPPPGGGGGDGDGAW